MSRLKQVQPPKLSISAPDFNLPLGATDCHAHVFESRFPLCHDRSYTPAEAGISQYLNVLKTLGFDRAVMVQPSVYGTDNSAILQCMSDKDSGIKFRGVAVVHPDISDEELAFLHQSGIRGVRLNLLFRGGGSKDRY